jgi:hypothetical protein
MPSTENFNTIPFLVEVVDLMSKESIETKSDATQIIETARINCQNHKSMNDCQSISNELVKNIGGQVVIARNEFSRHAIVIKDDKIYDNIFGNYGGVKQGELSIQGVNSYRYEGNVFGIKRSSSRAGNFIEQSYIIPELRETKSLKEYELTASNFKDTPFLATIWSYFADGHLGGSFSLLNRQDKAGKISIKCEVPINKNGFESFSYQSDTSSFDSKSTKYIEVMAKLSEQLKIDKREAMEYLSFVVINYSQVVKLKTLLNS